MLRIASVLFGLLAIAACGSDQESPPALARSEVKTLSDKLDVEPLQERAPSRPHSMKGVCGPTQCLLLYELESELVEGTFLYATRVDSEGRVLDEPPKLLSPPPLGYPDDAGLGRLTAVAAGSDGTFLVSWCDYMAVDDGCHQEIYSTRLELDGTLHVLTPMHPQEPLTSLTLAGGSNYLFLDPQGVIRDLGEYAFEEVAAPMLVRAVVPGDAQFLLLGVGSVARFDPTTRTMLDEQPIPVTSDGAELRGAFSSSAYHLFWESPTTGGGTRTLGLRVSRDSGQVLEPTLTETSTPGARVYIDPAPPTLQVAASADAVLLLSATPAALDLWKVNASTGEAAGARNETHWPGETTAFQLLIGEGSGMLLADSEPSTLRAVTTTWGADFGLAFGAALPFLFRAEPRLSPFVASNGTDYAVTWRQPSGSYATRLDATSGAYTAAPTRFAEPASDTGVLLSEPHVAVWGDAYKFVFLRQSGADSALVMGDVFSGAQRTLATDVGFDSRGASAVCRGPYCLVAWIKSGAAPVLTGVRVDATSVSQPFAIGRGTALEEFSTTLIAGPSPDADQAWVIFAEATADADPSFWLRSYRFSTSELGTAIYASGVISPLTAQSESRLVSLWKIPGDLRSLYHGLQVDVDTEAVDYVERVTEFVPPSNFDLASFWYDGISLVGIWTGMDLQGLPSAFEPRTFLIRLSNEASLRVLDSNRGTVISSDYSQCSGAARGDGHSLIACNAADHTTLSATIQVRLFEHDGKPAIGGAGSGGQPGSGGLANGARGGESSGGGANLSGGTGGSAAAGAGNAGESPGEDGNEESKGCSCHLKSASDGNRSALLGLSLALACVIARRRGRPRT